MSSLGCEGGGSPLSSDEIGTVWREGGERGFRCWLLLYLAASLFVGGSRQWR